MSKQEKTVEFKPLRQDPEYLIGSDGSVFSMKVNRYLKLQNGDFNKKYVQLHINKNQETFYVDELVTQNFREDFVEVDLGHQIDKNGCVFANYAGKLVKPKEDIMTGDPLLFLRYSNYDIVFMRRLKDVMADTFMERNTTDNAVLNLNKEKRDCRLSNLFSYYDEGRDMYQVNAEAVQECNRQDEIIDFITQFEEEKNRVIFDDTTRIYYGRNGNTDYLDLERYLRNYPHLNVVHKMNGKSVTYFLVSNKNRAKNITDEQQQPQNEEKSFTGKIKRMFSL